MDLLQYDLHVSSDSFQAAMGAESHLGSVRQFRTDIEHLAGQEANTAALYYDGSTWGVRLARCGVDLMIEGHLGTLWWPNCRWPPADEDREAFHDSRTDFEFNSRLMFKLNPECIKRALTALDDTIRECDSMQAEAIRNPPYRRSK
jgi:hypothetical protein